MFWSSQAICSEQDVNIPGKILSKTSVDQKFLTLPIGYRFTGWTATQIINQEELLSIFSFLNLYNTTHPQPQVLVTLEFLKWLANSSTLWAGIEVLRTDPINGSESWHLVGISLCYPVQVNIFSQHQLLGHTSYLCVSPFFRKKGLASILIAQIMKLTQIRKIYPGYHHVDFEIGFNSIPTPLWIRPLRKSTRLATCIPNSQTYIWRPMVYHPGWSWSKCHLKDREEIETLRKAYPVRLSQSSFQEIYDCPIYFIRKICFEGEVQGYIGGRMGILQPYFNPKDHIQKPSNFEKFRGLPKCYFAGIEFFLSQKPFTTQSQAFQYSLRKLREKFDLAVFYQLGSLSPELLTSGFAYLSGVKYLNWYNWSGNYPSSDCLLPLL